MTETDIAGHRAAGPFVLRVLVGAVVAGVPVFFLRSTLEPFDTPKLSFLLVGVGVSLLALAWFRPSGAWGSVRPLVAPAGAVLVPLAVATAFSPYRSWTLLGEHARYAGLIPYAATVIVAFLVAIAFAGRGAALAATIVASTTAVAGYALLQMFGADPFDWFSSIYVASTVGHSNFSGAVMAIGLPLALALWARGGRVGRSARVAVVVLGAALIGSFSQGAWLAAVGGCAVVAASRESRNRPIARRIGYGVAAIIGLALVASVVITQLFPSGPLAGSSTWTRGLHWRTALVMAADSPIVGHGANTYALSASRYRSPTEAMIEGNADDPHSVPLGVLAHAGVAGAAGIAVLMIWLIRRVRASSADPIAGGFAGAAASYVLVALVTVDHLVLRTLFWAVLGGLAVSLRRAIPRRPLSPSLWHATRFVLVPVAAISISLGIGIVVADIHMARAIGALDANDAGRARSEFRRATGFGGQWEQRRLFGEAVGRAGLRNRVTNAAVTDLRSAFEPIIVLPESTWRATFADWLTQWSPDRPDLIRSARGAWNDVIEVNPYDPRTGINLADLALLEGRPESALAALARFEGQLAQTYPPGVLSYPDYWGALAIAREWAGDGAGARAALVKAQTLGSQACHTLIAGILFGAEADRSERLNASFRCPPIALALLDQGRTGPNPQ